MSPSCAFLEGTFSPLARTVEQMDDEALLERARSGDRDAFADIVTRYQDDLYTMALRLLGRPADAADVVQETFLRAFTKLPSLRGTTLRPWLYRVAVNAGRDVLRRNARRPTDPLQDEEGRVVELPDPAMGPEAHAVRRERVDAVRGALLQLPIDFRMVVVLRDVNDLSYEEIADTLGVPMGTVKSRINRARMMLAQNLRTSTTLFAIVEGDQ